ncbi:MAG: hypothetical protein LBQ42_11595 [Synergistaceae bacterium]|nr:hypothetical protein [Synergistaceae bacterium]
MKKSQEKFEIRIEKSLEDLKQDMNKRFEKTDKAVDGLREDIKDLHKEMNDRLWWLFGAIVLSILVPVILKYL